MLELLRFVERDGMSESIRAIEARRVVESMTDRITNEGLPQPNLDALGEAFAAAFDRWLVDLVYWLRAGMGARSAPSASQPLLPGSRRR